MEKIIELSDLNKKIESYDKVILMVTAEWCGECKMAKLLIDKVRNDYQDIIFMEIDVDDNNLWDDKTLNVTQVPTFIGYKGKNIIFNSSGYKVEEELRKLLDSLRA